MPKSKINQYQCDTCGEVITTIDRTEGTTPMTLLCRSKSDCPGRMFSNFYLVDQRLEPNYEWYKPKKLPRNRDLRQHVKLGGLLIRKIKDA